MVSLTIDGKQVEVEKGSTILDAAASIGIKIPTLCWLQKVSPTGACRVCAVEIEGVDRPITACNTPVKDGIVVTTQSDKLAAIRRKVVELLLINHPLDCPVCDAGGECGLQDACYGLGASRQEYAALPERRPIRYDWPLIESDPNRCILCEKCVKVDHEVVGADAIEVANCGEATIIETVDGKPLDCEFCGNCVGVCPTGTLISKPFKFRGRPWSFKVTPSVCAFCSAGCQIEYHSRNGRIERVTSDDSTYNSGNLCINGRFGYSYLNSPKRLTAPLLKIDGVQQASDWNKAMNLAVEKLRKTVQDHGAGAVAGIASPRATNEENYLFQKMLRGAIGTNNIDSEARFGFAAAQRLLRLTFGLSGANNPVDRIDEAAAVLVIGCDLNAEATGVEYRVIKAATKNDAKLVLANMRGVKLKKFANCHLQYRPHGESALLTALIKVIVEADRFDSTEIAAQGLDVEAIRKAVAASSLADLAAAAGVSENYIKESANLLAGKKSAAIIFGSDLLRSSASDNALGLLFNLAVLIGAVGKETGGLFPIHEKTNVQGLLDMGCLPEGATSPDGKNLWQILEGIENGVIKALYLMGSNPLAGFPESERFRQAFQKLDLLIVQDIFANDCTGLAHIVFPGAAAAEKAGSFTTIDNRVQYLTKAVEPPGDAREDWDILTELNNRLAFVSSVASPAAIAAEIREANPLYRKAAASADPRSRGDLAKGCSAPAPGAKLPAVELKTPPAAVAEYPFVLLAGPILFHSGTMSTYSENNLEVSPEGYIEICPEDAGRLGIAEGARITVSTSSASVSGAAKVSSGLQPGLLFAPYHFAGMNVSSLLRGNANLVNVKVAKG